MRAPPPPTSSMVSVLTVPAVPTGMKVGVWTTPCGVTNRPALAVPAVASTWNSNMSGRNVMPAVRVPAARARLTKEPAHELGGEHGSNRPPFEILLFGRRAHDLGDVARGAGR